MQIWHNCRDDEGREERTREYETYEPIRYRRIPLETNAIRTRTHANPIPRANTGAHRSVRTSVKSESLPVEYLN